MQKTIRKKLYDTETAERLGGFTEGAYGNPAGYEEHLYRTPAGAHFLYGRGGPDSPWPEETIRPLSIAKAKDWLAIHAPA